MKHQRMFWLLLLVLFQPAFTRADCNVTWTSEELRIVFHDIEIVYKFYIQCTDVTLYPDVPLTWYMSGYVSAATNALIIEFSLSAVNTVPESVFHAFNAIRILSMNNVSINSISPGVFSGMTQLQQLYLNNNNISELQADTFDGLDQLTKLEMSGNKLTTLKSLNGLTKLKDLDVSDNQLVNLSATLFSTLPELRTLNLKNNYIDHIPAGLFNTTKSLLGINLRNNTIRSVPCNELMGLVNLSFNRITSLVHCSENILRLEVSYNYLTSLPAMFFNEAASLTTLGLTHNNISTIHGDAFVELRSLTGLSMNNNKITTIPIGTFRNLAKLITLNLSHNNLMDLTFGVFTGLTNLHELDVSNNKIAKLESKVLFPLKSLTQLKFDGNLLRTFDAHTMVSQLTTLESISLDRNQMQCEWLISCINVFTLHNITVLVGDSFKTSNVHGIYCVGENEHGNVTIPTDAVVPTQATSSSATRKPSTTPLSVTTVDERADVSTFTVERPSTTPYLSAEDKISKTLRADREETNDLLVVLLKAHSNYHIFVTATIIILIIMILAISLFNMCSIKRINMKEKKTNSPCSCGVELLHGK